MINKGNIAKRAVMAPLLKKRLRNIATPGTRISSQ
jgi:hypothetical protein